MRAEADAEAEEVGRVEEAILALEAAAAEAEADVVPAGSDEDEGGEVPNRDAETVV